MILDYKGHVIEQRDRDGYVNITQMANVFSKKVHNWTKFDSSEKFLIVVSEFTAIPVEKLLIALRGNSSKYKQGTFAHPLIAITFSEWLDWEFYLWCLSNIKIPQK